MFITKESARLAQDEGLSPEGQRVGKGLYAPEELRIIRGASRARLLVLGMIGAYWNIHRPQDELTSYRLHHLFMEAQTTPLSEIVERANASLPIRSEDPLKTGPRKEDHSKEWLGDISSTDYAFKQLSQLGVIRTKLTKPEQQVASPHVVMATAAAIKELCIDMDTAPEDIFSAVHADPKVADATTQRARIYQILIQGQEEVGDDFFIPVRELAKRLGVGEESLIHNYLDTLALDERISYTKDRHEYARTENTAVEVTDRVKSLGTGFFDAIYQTVIHLPANEFMDTQKVYDAFLLRFGDTYRRATLFQNIGSALHELVNQRILRPHYGVGLPAQPQRSLLLRLVRIMDESVNPSADFLQAWKPEAVAFLDSPKAINTFVHETTPSAQSPEQVLSNIMAAQKGQALTLPEISRLAHQQGLTQTPQHFHRILKQEAERGVLVSGQVHREGERPQTAWELSPQWERRICTYILEQKQVVTLDSLAELLAKEGMQKATVLILLRKMQQQGHVESMQVESQERWQLTPRGKAYEYGRRILQHGMVSSNGDFYFGEAADQFIARHVGVQKQLEQSLGPIARFSYDNEIWYYIRDGKRLSDQQDEIGQYKVPYTKELTQALKALQQRFERSRRR